MNRIQCSVSTCAYNKAGEVCQADEIQVKNNMGATDDMEIGSLGEEADARTSIETCCETFVPKKA
jgi:hypothetical protein